MKLRILNYRLTATHGSITALANYHDPVSISDYDAFVFDPAGLVGQMNGADFIRRRQELNDLVFRKGGIVVSLLRPNEQLNIPGMGVDRYAVLDLAGAQSVQQVRASLRSGEGSQIRLLPAAKGALSAYFRILNGKLRFASYVDTADANVAQAGGTVFAVDSVGHLIGLEFVVGSGRVCFVPLPDSVDGERVGSAIVRVVEAHFGGPTGIDAPSWATAIEIPGSGVHDARIVELTSRRDDIDSEIGELEQKRRDLLSYRVLLYGYGKSVLEPVVRSAFRLLGFEVPEPDSYKGEWDFELSRGESGGTAVGEVEGSEGVIDIDKYRQLRDYVEDEFLAGRDHKGVLVGNGYRLKELDSPERQNQFSEHVLRGAQKNGFCVMPTTELFKAICAVLEGPEDEALKLEIRNSIFSTVGVWAFAREAKVAARQNGPLEEDQGVA